MTRDEFEKAIKKVGVSSSAEIYFSNKEALLAHDAEQRQVIEELKQELFDERSLHVATKEFLKAQTESVLNCAAKVQQQAQQIATLREALQRLVDLLGGACRLDHHGHCQEHFLTAPCEVQQAQQALKGQPIRGVDAAMIGCGYAPKVNGVYIGEIRRALSVLQRAWSQKEWGK